MLIASRALLGVAGATIAPSTLSLIFVMFEEPRQRSTAVGIWVSAFSAGGVIGPILGGLLLEQFWWGSVFLLAVPVMAVLLLVGPRVLPEYRDPSAGRLDLVSVALSLVAILALIFGLKTVAQDGIGVVPLGAIAVGLVVGAVWVRRQLTAADPMFDLRLFRIPRFTTSLAINFLAIFLAVGYFLFVAQYMQLVLGLTPFEAALWSLPEAVAFIIGPNIAPRIVRRVRPAYLLAGGFAIAGVGLAILGSITASTPERAGPRRHRHRRSSRSGSGPVFGLTTELIVGSAPPERAGAATGMSETGSEVGGALGLSILGTIGLAIYRVADRRRSCPPACRTLRPRPPATPSALRSRSRGRCRRELGAAVCARSPRTPSSTGMQVAAIISVVLSVLVAVVTFVGLRHVPPTDAQPLGTAQAGEAFDDTQRLDHPGPRIRGMSVRFRTTILTTGKTTMGFEVPASAVEALGAGKRPPVTVTINGYTYRNSIAVMGGDVHDRRELGPSRPGGVSGGEEIDVELALDTAPREVTVPPELAAALDADPAAKATFERLSYSNKSWHALQVTGTNNPETRARRIEKSIAALRDGRIR